MPKDLDAEIDALYQLPLDEFTPARNALAKNAGKDAAAVKQLTKPPLAAWAVNQLYWERRDDYDALIEAAEEMRRTHKAVIEGKKGDLRAASREHERAVDAALKSTIAALKDRGQPVTDVTRQGILNTLRALPSAEEPGRLGRVLSPGGFEMLAGVNPAAVKAGRKTAKDVTPAKAAKPAKGDVKGLDKAAREAARLKAERDAAERELREAEQHARRTEFETARAIRDAAKADKHLESARAALERAREALESAERDVTVAEREAAAAGRARETAERKARDAESAVAAARARLQKRPQS